MGKLFLKVMSGKIHVLWNSIVPCQFNIIAEPVPQRFYSKGGKPLQIWLGNNYIIAYIK